MSRSLIVPLLLCLSCKDKDKVETTDTVDTGPEPWRPALACPGDAGCESAGDGGLMAGAAKASITPTCFESWTDLDADGEYDFGDESFLDCGCDRLCSDDEGYPGADAGEEDGEFQAVWMAGFQNGRPATGVHDDLLASVVVLRQGDSTLALVVVDVVGYFNDEVLKVRQEVADAGLDVDHVIVSATHVHEGPDTMGLWGKQPFDSGVDPEYMAYIRSQIVVAIGDALDDVQPVSMKVGIADAAAASPDKGTRNLIRDSRDPVIVDENVYAAQLIGADGDTVATLVNWGNHPEALSDENTLLTSDYSHYIRTTVEDGPDVLTFAAAGLGGVCIYVNGTVGGLMTPLGVTVTDIDGAEYSESNWDKAKAIGQVVGGLAVQSLSDAEVQDSPALSFRYSSFYLPIDNFAFQALALAHVIDRQTYNWDEEEDIDEDNIPEMLTEVDVVELGPIRMLSVPGELFPELAIGGYDGSRVNTTLDDFIDPANPNPPDVSAAPEAPYLKDRLGADYNWIIGLGNDEVGYIVPPYDFKVDEYAPYISEAEGDHYEETNSVGPQTADLVVENATQLIEWAP